MSVSKYISIQFSSVLCWGVVSWGLQTHGGLRVGGPVVSSNPHFSAYPLWVGSSSMSALL